MTVQIEALAVAEQLHRAARHAIFPRAKIVACTPCIEQAHALAPFITAIEREAKAAGLRNAALSLEIGQLVGARQLDAMADQIEREGQA